MRALLHNRPAFLVFRGFFKIFFLWKLNAHTSPAGTIPTPCLVLSNHTTNQDPIILGTSFPILLHYLASDHIFRKGWISRLLVAMVEPIPRLKATTEIASTKRILQKLRSGDSVCIFPEGNRTWSGETAEIPESVSKLAKKAGVAVVTYRIEGGYFTSPRWSHYLRKGKITGAVVNVYGSSQIEGMTAEQLDEAIQTDLYVDAYADQGRNPVPYRGKNIAEDLELALYLCPDCGGIGTLESNGDAFSCPCGLQLLYSKYGYFETADGTNPPYSTVLEWFRWQKRSMGRQIENYLLGREEKPIFHDAAQTLYMIERATGQRLIGEGALEAYGDRLQMVDQSGKCILGSEGEHLIFPWKDVTGMSIHGPKVLVFSTAKGNSYEIRTETRRSPVKYLDFYDVISAQNRHLTHE